MCIKWNFELFQGSTFLKGEAMNIFLLEDDDAIGMGLKYSLEKEGYNVTLTKSVAKAKESFEEKKNDLIRDHSLCS